MTTADRIRKIANSADYAAPELLAAQLRAIADELTGPSNFATALDIVAKNAPTTRIEQIEAALSDDGKTAFETERQAAFRRTCTGWNPNN